jgi:putative redox protein
MEAVLMALCSCTSVDVVSILKKKREPIASLTVSATPNKPRPHPESSPKSMLTYKIGGGVSQKAAEDAVSLSKEQILLSLQNARESSRNRLHHRLAD